MCNNVIDCDDDRYFLIYFIAYCDADKFRCGSGQCITKDKECNNVKDCDDFLYISQSPAAPTSSDAIVDSVLLKIESAITSKIVMIFFIFHRILRRQQVPMR